MCYRPPWIFGAVFEAAKAFIDPKTASKILFVNGDDKDGSENDKKMHEVIGTQRRIDRKRGEESSREMERKRTEQNRTEQNREEENIGKEEGQAEKSAEQSGGEGSLSRPCSRHVQSQSQYLPRVLYMTANRAHSTIAATHTDIIRSIIAHDFLLFNLFALYYTTLPYPTLPYPILPCPTLHSSALLCPTLLLSLLYSVPSLLGPNWKVLTGAGQPRVASGCSPGYNHAVFWPKYVRLIRRIEIIFNFFYRGFNS